MGRSPRVPWTPGGGLLLPAHADHRAGPGRPADAGGDLRPGAGLDHLPHARPRRCSLANNTRYGLAASVWSRTSNLRSTSRRSSPRGSSGSTDQHVRRRRPLRRGARKRLRPRRRLGGDVAAYTRPARKAKPLKPRSQPNRATGGPAAGHGPHREALIGGKQARPDGGYSRAVHGREGQAARPGAAGQPQGRAQRGGGGAGRRRLVARAGTQGAQVLYYIAENLAAGARSSPRGSTRRRAQGGRAEVEAAIDRLFTYAAWADKFDGRVAQACRCAGWRWRCANPWG